MLYNVYNHTDGAYMSITYHYNGVEIYKGVPSILWKLG